MLEIPSARAFTRSLPSRIVAITPRLLILMVVVCGLCSPGIAANHNTQTIEGTKTWTLVDSPHFVSGLVTVAEGGKLIIESGAVVYFTADGRSGILINGSLSAVGALSAPIYLGTVADLGPSSPATQPADHWRGIQFQNAQNSSVLERVVIVGALVGVHINNSVVELNDSTILNCSKATQVDGQKSLVKIQRSHFTGNEFDLDALRAPSTTVQLLDNQFEQPAAAPGTLSSSVFTGMGPLLASSTNTRYFFTPSGKPVYFTGSHTWPNLIDKAPGSGASFDFGRYLDLLHANGHNLIRLWSRHVFKYQHYGSVILYSEPLAWPRTGPGTALDGKPKFDLGQFNQTYFDRLRQRVIDAQSRGIYVDIMLFGGRVEAFNEWEGNPFNGNNNINGINGDTNSDGAGQETQTWPLPPNVEDVQKHYVRKVIDSVSDLDNVLFEISNESDGYSVGWQAELIRYIKRYESSKGGYLRHPVGMTALWDGNNSPILGSNADWISIAGKTFDGDSEPMIGDPPVASSGKVSIMDSDHLFFDYLVNQPVRGINWVWKSFTRGHNPILMENLFSDSTGGLVPVTVDDPGFYAARTAMADTTSYASKIKLAAMVPNAALSSTAYALANPGSEYLVFQPRSQGFTVDVHPGVYIAEWFNPTTHALAGTSKVTLTTTTVSFTPPFSGPAVLYLKYDSPLSP